MSNFKEIYPQKNFREDLYRMDSLGEDNYEVWAYNGEPDYAPLSADYTYELVRNTKVVSGKDIIIEDAISMPIESFKLYGESLQSGTPTMASPKAFTKIGIYNPSTNYYEIKCYNQTGLNLLSNASLVSVSVKNGTGTPGSTKTSLAFTFDSSFTKENFAGKTMTFSFDVKAHNATEDTSPDYHRWGGEFCFKKEDNTNSYNGLWFRVNNWKKDGRYQSTFGMPSNWNGNTSGRNLYIQRLATGDVEIKNAKLEFGSKMTPFSLNPADPNYQAPNQELIYSPQPLMSLPSGIRDEYDNGCLYLRTVYDYFRNTDNWQLDTVRSNSNITIISLFTKKAVNNSIDLWCTHFKPNEDLSQPNRIKIENQRIYISASATDCPDLDSFLRWMGNNQVYICYPRKGTLKVMSEPSVLLHTYEERTEIVNDQNAEMYIEYRVAPNARVWKKQEDGTFIELTS